MNSTKQPRRPLEFILQAIIGGSELVEADRCYAPSYQQAQRELAGRHPNLVRSCGTQVVQATDTEA